MKISNTIKIVKNNNDFPKKKRVEFFLSLIIKRLNRNALATIIKVIINVGIKVNKNLPKTTSKGEVFHLLTPISGVPK